jgi:hypothetical protein
MRKVSAGGLNEDGDSGAEPEIPIRRLHLLAAFPTGEFEICKWNEEKGYRRNRRSELCNNLGLP